MEWDKAIGNAIDPATGNAIPACGDRDLAILRNKINAKLVGMTKRQVRYLLGTPVIKDNFKPNEWIYAYTYEAFSMTCVWIRTIM